MSLTLENLTFIIVTFKSEHIIHNCIKSLPEKSKIIVIENSNDIKLKDDLERAYQDIKVIIQDNTGMGSANNKGINLCQTDYAFVINPDVNFQKDCIQKMINFSKIKNDYCILAPILDDVQTPNYKIGKKLLINNNEQYLEVDSVDGFAMLINKKEFKDNDYFDENFFLYLENDDLCLRKKKENKKIYILKTAMISHLGGQSTSPDLKLEIENSRNWHWMWSRFYFNKKHYGYLKAFFTTFPKLISSLIKYFYYYLFNQRLKKNIYKMRFLGLFNSMILKKSWYRPKI